MGFECICLVLRVFADDSRVFSERGKIKVPDWGRHVADDTFVHLYCLDLMAQLKFQENLHQGADRGNLSYHFYARSNHTCCDIKCTKVFVPH